MKKKIVYKHIHTKDLQSLLNLLYDLYNNDIGKDFDKIIKALLKDKSYFKLGAFDCNKLIGFILGSQRLEIDFECRTGIIEEIVVEKEYRKVGIGKTLLQHFTKWAKAQKCKGILVPAGREGFYEKMGFEKFNVKRYWKEI